MAEEKAGDRFFKNKERPGLKALVVGALVLIMTVPLFFVSVIAQERKDRAEQVLSEVAGEWSGREQTLAGPFLVLPINHNEEVGSGEYRRINTTRRYAVILPEELHFRMQAQSEILRRGIYQAPVFSGEISATGNFPAIDPLSIAEPMDDILWQDAFVTLSLSDMRGIRSPIRLQMNQSDHIFQPGAGLEIYGSGGAHVNLAGTYEAPEASGETAASTSTSASGSGSGSGHGAMDFARDQSFRFDFTLNGTSRLRFIPIGQSTTAEISSDWPSPSFQGAFLPINRTTSEEGFSANWSVPNLARSFPDQFVVVESRSRAQADAMGRAIFGVDFIVPLDHYQKIFRALRYAVIFVGFTFLAFFLVELVLKTRLHPVQYVLIGVAQSVFYLLLLSASEHIGFAPSFAMAASATVALITAYGGFISRSVKVALVLLAVLSMIYLILYGLLQVEDLALLLGSAALFGALALTMLVTRNVNWYGDSGNAGGAEIDKSKEPILKPS